MTETNDSRQHLIFAILLGIAGLLIILIFVTIKSQGSSDATTSANVTNASPSVDSVFITTTTTSLVSENISLTDNSTESVYINGTFTDNNGCDEVTGGLNGAGITSTLYRSGVGSGCSADNLNCYRDVSCSYSGCTPGGSDVDGIFSCTATVQYYAQPTDSGAYSAETWLATTFASDETWNGTDANSETSGAASTTSSGVELTSLTGLGLGPDGTGENIAYGALALGATSASDVNLTIRNTGNIAIDPKVNGTDLTCDGAGTVPVANQKYATSTGVSYTNKIALSAVATYMSACIPVATGTASSTTSTFWMVQLPSSGVAGSCSGTNTVNAFACP